MIKNPDIQKLVDKIVELVNPLEIILFGSHARGEINADSDIDLMVVMPDGVHTRKMAMHLYSSIRGIKTPYDIMVATPSILELHKDNIGLIYKTILKEGKTIYVS